MNWLADELGIGRDNIQVYVANTFAMSSDIKPCETCARLKNTAAVLSDPQGTDISALAAVINEVAPPDVPPSPEQMTLIASTLASGANDNTQYAAAGQWLDALAQYVGIMNNELGYSKAESVALAGKYIAPATAKGNAAPYSVYRGQSGCFRRIIE